MNDNDNVKISPEEISELLDLIKSGKTFRQIGQEINKKFKEDIPKIKNVKVKEVKEIIGKQEPYISLSIECTFNEKKVMLGANEPLNSRELSNAYEDLYYRLLKSLDHIINMSV